MKIKAYDGKNKIDINLHEEIKKYISMSKNKSTSSGTVINITQSDDSDYVFDNEIHKLTKEEVQQLMNINSVKLEEEKWVALSNLEADSIENLSIYKVINNVNFTTDEPPIPLIDDPESPPFVTYINTTSGYSSNTNQRVYQSHIYKWSYSLEKWIDIKPKIGFVIFSSTEGTLVVYTSEGWKNIADIHNHDTRYYTKTEINNLEIDCGEFAV